MAFSDTTSSSQPFSLNSFDKYCTYCTRLDDEYKVQLFRVQVQTWWRRNTISHRNHQQQ